MGGLGLMSTEEITMSTPTPRPLDAEELERLAAASGLHVSGSLMRDHLAPVVEALIAERTEAAEAAVQRVRGLAHEWQQIDSFTAGWAAVRVLDTLDAVELPALDQPKDGV